MGGTAGKLVPYDLFNGDEVIRGIFFLLSCKDRIRLKFQSITSQPLQLYLSQVKTDINIQRITFKRRTDSDTGIFILRYLYPFDAFSIDIKIRKEVQKMGEFNLNEKISEIKQEITVGTASLTSSKEVYEFKKTFLDNKTGKIGLIMKEMKNIPAEERADFGKSVNELKNWALATFDELDGKLKAEEAKKRYENEKIDVTMPSIMKKAGKLHPNTLIRNQLTDIFASMGFKVFEGSEIETDYYNFTALNIPKDHPARDMQDTFYLTPEFLLRTQTSSGQVHVMESQKPPIKIISPGKVFRADDDATHSPMFTQMEGLVVDKGITLCDLKGMLDTLVKNIFGEGTRTRLRPSYFPFTEPSVEVDVSCFNCGGKGCSLCKGTGWIEVLGAGIVNKKVLDDCGIDSNVYSGLAFGIGIERLAMLKYGINNIKLLFESDLRVLEQLEE